MLGRKRAAAPADDETVAIVPVFTGDVQRGAALFHNITGGQQGTGRPVIDSRVTQAWHGWTQPPQQFRGAAGLGDARPTVPTTTRLDQEHGAAAGTAEQIFAERMTARRFS